jgi:hypothetical protein
MDFSLRLRALLVRRPKWMRCQVTKQAGVWGQGLNPYLAFHKHSREEVERLKKEDTELLGRFGLNLVSATPGVLRVTPKFFGRLHAHDLRNIPWSVWVWLKPLLQELERAREASAAPELPESEPEEPAEKGEEREQLPEGSAILQYFDLG